MKFSVLLPTRNRLELLRYAIESVRRQDYQDWELVVSDNDSSEAVEPHVSALRDPRIRYVRTSRFVPVTENWNHALMHSTGDYVVMLGDDDSLLPGSLKRLAGLIARHAAPDTVYVQALQFAYPGVMPGNPGGFVQTGYCEFMSGRSAPFLLSPEQARSAVTRSMALRLSFSFNMQHVFVSRAAIDRLARYGTFYQSPYPDYYASNVLLLTSRSVLVVPEPLVAIGISPRSFGYYYFNAREEEGTAFLNNLETSALPEAARAAVLPGSVLLTSWFLAMGCIEHNFGREYGLRADRERYRYLQVVGNPDLFPRLEPRAELRKLRQQWGKLSAGEILHFGLRRAMLYLAPRVLRGWGLRWREDLLARESPFPRFDPRKRAVAYRNILELFEDWSRLREDLARA